MTLWRLEWLRLVRTHRALALLLVFLFFGLTAGPLAYYRDQLFEAIGGGSSGITVTAQPAVPADGIIQYVSQASQIGILVFALVAASALAFDANRERSIFLRSRVRSTRQLVLVKYSVNVAAAAVAFDLGALGAWYGTAVLIGPVPVGGMVAGMVYTDLYLAFLGALVAIIAARTASVAAPAVGAVAVALGLALLGVNHTLATWLPSHLVGSLADLATGTGPGTYLGAAAVTVVATVGLLAATVALADRREL